MTKIKKVFRAWLPLLFILSMFYGAIYVAVQQNFRQSANDPQIQIARDQAQALQEGKTAQDIVGQTSVDLSKSLAPFVIIYDDALGPIASQAVLDGRIPTPPQGVFDYTKTHKEDKVTWQPKPNIRIASVLERFEGPKPGFILVGRSLKEVEQRVSDLGNKLMIGWIITAVGSLILVVLLA